jgi:MoaA/NifB/PqqE/SkfB family radical SAM enzyme
MKNLDYYNFQHKIHLDAQAKRLPLHVMFELTYQCNFKCAHCYVPCSYRKQKILPTSKVLSVISQLKNAGSFYLGFTGGEIFTRPDFMKILEFSCRQGFEIMLYTNGSLITKDIAKRIAKLKVNKIDITLPGFTKNTFEKISHSPGSHKKVFKAIDYLKKYSVPLGLKRSRLLPLQLAQITVYPRILCPNGIIRIILAA